MADQHETAQGVREQQAIDRSVVFPTARGNFGWFWDVFAWMGKLLNGLFLQCFVGSENWRVVFQDRCDRPLCHPSEVPPRYHSGWPGRQQDKRVPRLNNVENHADEIATDPRYHFPGRPPRLHLYTGPPLVDRRWRFQEPMGAVAVFSITRHFGGKSWDREIPCTGLPLLGY